MQIHVPSRNFGREYRELYPWFEACLIDIVALSDDRIPASLLRELEFFIDDPHLGPECATNTSLAIKIGRLKLDGEGFILVKAIQCLFLARDRVLKDFLPANIKELLDRCALLISSIKAIKILDLNE